MDMVAALLLVAMSTLLDGAKANMFDLLQPLKLRPSECTRGCARWAALAADGSTANQTAVDEAWAAGSAPPGAGNQCAQQGRGLTFPQSGWGTSGNYSDGWNGSSPWDFDLSQPGGFGAFCYCAHRNVTPGSSLYGYCQSPRLSPEQLNIQLAGPTSVVISFVTFGDITEYFNLTAPPTAEYWLSIPNGRGQAKSATVTTVSGVSTAYDTNAAPYNKAGRDSWKPQPERKYTMHFIRLSGLAPRTSYNYRVRSGNDLPLSKSGIWSGKPSNHTSLALHAHIATIRAVCCSSHHHPI
jgi:hypothetical protein